MMFSQAIVDEAIARTGVYRYDYLCLRHPDAQVRADYQRLVTEIATGTYTGQRFEPRAETPTISTGGCGGCPGNPYG